MLHRKYAPLVALALAACTFTTADVGPTATSLRSAHDALAREFSALDEKLAPSETQVNDACAARRANDAGLIQIFCREWSGLTSEQRTARVRELRLQPRINQTLTALLAYVQALDALVKSREQSQVQADLLQERLHGLSSVSAALGGPATVFSRSAAGIFANAASAFDGYQSERAALRAAEHAQAGLDILAAGVRAVFGECDIELSERMRNNLSDENEACEASVRVLHEDMVSAIVDREAEGAELQYEVAFTLYQAEGPEALARLRAAYDARADAAPGSSAYDRANRDVDVALRDLDALERVRPQYEAVVAARRAAEEWRVARARGRRATVEAFIQAADQNAALAEAIRRERQLDLGPLGFIIRSLLGA